MRRQAGRPITYQSELAPLVREAGKTETTSATGLYTESVYAVAALTVLALSLALMPVVVPSRTSTDTAIAVYRNSVFSRLSTCDMAV